MIQPMEIVGFKPESLRDAEVRRHLRRSLDQRRLIVLKCQRDLQADEQLDLSRIFGIVRQSQVIDRELPSEPNIQMMYRQPKEAEPNPSQRISSSFYWHADGSFLRKPPAVTILRGVVIPQFGGDTLFADVKGAFDRTSSSVKESLACLTATHSYSLYHRALQRSCYDEKERNDARHRFPDVVHSLLIDSPFGSWNAPYISELCVEEIKNPDGEDSTDAVRDIYAAATHPRNVYRHAWTPGDVLIWLNVGTMHRGTPAQGERLMYRTIAGEIVDPRVEIRSQAS